MSKKCVPGRRALRELLDIPAASSSMVKSAEKSVPCPLNNFPAAWFSEFQAKHEPKLLEKYTVALNCAKELNILLMADARRAKRITDKKRKVSPKSRKTRAKRAKTFHEDRQNIFKCVMCGDRASKRRANSSNSDRRNPTCYKCKNCSAELDNGDGDGDDGDNAHREVSPCVTNTGVQIISSAMYG